LYPVNVGKYLINQKYCEVLLIRPTSGLTKVVLIHAADWS